MAQCRATKANAEPCRGTATGPHGLCWAHAPENAEQRRRGAVRGGKAKANRELPGIKAQLQGLVQDVLDGEVETGRAAVANQLLNTRLRAVELERKIKETDELEARLEALEQADERRKGGQRWGA
ncbi:MAG: hypothetical protein M3R38_10885 [Actinomycetota bacterium]|nr:hypothetical protein [Actinomycetota bacterium]MDP9476169.1 hypothetical protein [Actinomycetota bacterium]